MEEEYIVARWEVEEEDRAVRKSRLDRLLDQVSNDHSLKKVDKKIGPVRGCTSTSPNHHSILKLVEGKHSKYSLALSWAAFTQ